MGLACIFVLICSEKQRKVQVTKCCPVSRKAGSGPGPVAHRLVHQEACSSRPVLQSHVYRANPIRDFYHHRQTQRAATVAMRLDRGLNVECMTRPAAMGKTETISQADPGSGD